MSEINIKIATPEFEHLPTETEQTFIALFPERLNKLCGEAKRLAAERPQSSSPNPA